MHIDQARELTQTSLTALAEQLKAGQSDQLKAYLAMLGRFHQYSFNNVMLIAQQRPDATHVAGFQAWKSLGRYVKKGETALTIVAPMLLKQPDEMAAGSDDAEAPRIVRFRAVRVFDVSQTDGDPLPEPVRVGGEPGEYLDRLRIAVVGHSIVLEERPLPLGQAGFAAAGKIVVAAGMSRAETFSTLVHEFAHELLHHSGAKASKSVRETEAEAIAFVVARSIGLETGTSASDYISLYDGDHRTLAASLAIIQKTAAMIIDAIQPAASRTASDHRQAA